MTDSLIEAAKAEEMASLSADQVEVKSKWGYVITVPYEKDNHENAVLRGSVVKRLRIAGLDIKKSLSRDRDELFIYIEASDRLLRENAERMKLELPLQEEFGGGYFRFTVVDQDKFLPNSFTSTVKQHIIRYIIQAPTGANIAINRWKQDHKINLCFPLHTKEEVDQLDREMIRTFHPWNTPLHLVRRYFGEKFALYFAFLQHYILWLIAPALVGVGIFVTALTTGEAAGHDSISLFAIFISVWSTLFSKFWVRRSAVLAYNWNMRNFVKEEQELPTFEGPLEVGFNSPLGFIPLDETKYPNVKAKHYPEEFRCKKYLMSSPLFGGIIVAVIIGTVAIMFFRNINTYFQAFSGIINGAFIVIFNQLYNNLAIWLTNWENHRTESAWENALVIKKFCFQFVNSYISLYYIAFVKEHVSECLEDDCVYELGYQLAFIFLLQIFWGQFQEIGLPWVISRIKIRMEDSATARESGNVQPMKDMEYQAKLTPFEGLLDDYNEMMIQFGYVTLFSLAFPLAPLAAFLNNLFEVRVDGIKYLRGTQRPHYQGAANIGSWQTIMDFMSLGSVITNCAVMYWTVKVWDGSTIVFIEHATLVLKLGLIYFIPDTPVEIAKQMLREDYEHMLSLNPQHELEWEKAHPHADDDPDSDNFQDMSD